MITDNKYQDITDPWDQIFKEVTLTVIPYKYLHTISIQFKNNKSWYINCRAYVKAKNWDWIESQFNSIYKKYEDEITNIDFKLDEEKIKKDITASTKKLLKIK